MWKIRFRDDFHDKPIELYAEEVVMDDTSSYICIRGIRTKYKSQTIIVPGDKHHEEFAQFDPLYIGFNTLIFAGQIKEGNVKHIREIKDGAEDATPRTH